MLIYAIFLALLGGIGYGMTGAATAFIPAVLGIPVLILSQLAKRPGWRVRAIIGAAIIALFGVVAALGRLLPSLASGTEWTMATWTLAALAVSSLAYMAYAARELTAQRRTTVAA